MYGLVRVAAVPGAVSSKYVEYLEDYFEKISKNAVPEFKPPVTETGSPVIPWDVASQVMLSAMRTKKRLECGG